MSQDSRYNVLFVHATGLYYGSTEKLLQCIAKHLDERKFNVFFLYSDKKTGSPRRAYLEGSVHLIHFDYDYREEHEPFTLVGMKPYILDVIEENRIHCVFLDIFANYQFPVCVIPSTIPIVAVSPFGNWCSNGNVVKTYCSGERGKYGAERAGAKNAEVFFNPLNGPPEQYAHKPPVDDTVVFGRIGRPDNNIFDPISILAFKRLEQIYGDRVRYDVVAPPPAMVELAKSLGVKNVRFRDPITDDEALARFYYDIDVLAHARKDGETLGVAIAEAMIAGNPIITHRSHYNNTHLTFLEESFARWCEPDDVEAYFRNMRWFLENKDRIREMGVLARQKTWPLFGLPHVMARVSADLEQACQQSTYWARWGHLRGHAQIRFIHISTCARFEAGKMRAKLSKTSLGKVWRIAKSVLTSKKRLRRLFLGAVGRLPAGWRRRAVIALVGGMPAYQDNLPNMATRSRFGFWYVGNVLDPADIAYGVAQGVIPEQFETQLVQELLPGLDVFYDVGSNTGWYGVFVACMSQRRIRVFSFEPVEEFYLALLETVKLNRLDDCLSAYNVGLSDQAGKKQMYIAGTGSTVIHDFSYAGHKLPVREVTFDTLDCFVEANHIPLPDFIKIDVEGHELAVLRGGEKTIYQTKPMLLIELSDRLPRLGGWFVNPDYETTVALLQNWGYRLFECLAREERLIELVDTPRRTNVFMVFCLHEKEHVTILSRLSRFILA